MATRPQLFFPGLRVSIAPKEMADEYADPVAPVAPAAPAAPAVPAVPRKAAPAAPAVPRKAAPAVPAPTDFSYGDATRYAIDIKGEESSNPYSIETTDFPSQTRLGFQQKILKVFTDFIKIPEHGKELDYDACKKMGAAAGLQVEMYEYQKFVREYMKQATPYRGLLVYHGLGSGKTCSAIAAAEALFSVTKKKIIVMTPSSLQYNFIREISFCGFRHYRLQNHWTPLSTEDGAIRLFASQILDLPESYIKKHSQIWVPDFNEPVNFSSLSDEDRKEITLQLETQITNRITFIGYNGLTSSKLKEIACAAPDENGYGFFDNAVIIVDEIHNLTRLMQGTIEPYLSNLPNMKGRKVALEPVTPGRWEPELCKKPTDPRKPYLTNYKRGYLFYRLLAGARNSKLIGLSGTPLINFPEEIAILTNLIGGYIHTCSFSVTPATDENRAKIRKAFLENDYVDFEEVDLLGVNMNILFTVLPEGLIKAPDNNVRRVPPGTITPTIKETSEKIVQFITDNGMRVIGTPEFKSEPLLPPIGDEFRQNFLEGTELKNTAVLRKRLQGLVSYYRGSKKELMPTVTVDVLVNVPFSPYAQAEYQRIRTEELNLSKDKKEGEVGGKMANLWAELYDLAKLKQPNSYRMASRQACNFAFPEGITRPRPRDAKDAVAEIGDVKDVPVAEKEIEEEITLKGEEGEEEEAQKEDEAIDELPSEDATESPESPEFVPEIEAVTEGIVPVATPKTVIKSLTAIQIVKQQQEKKKEMCKMGAQPGEKYEMATKRAKDCLTLFASDKLRLFARGQNIVQKIRDGTPPDPLRLAKYSPKFAAILVKIIEAPGSSLVYSQFLDMEGIGIFSTVLEINDFHRIEIIADESGGKFAPATVANLMKGSGVNRFLTFTGGKDSSVRNLALKVFNARYSEEDNKFVELPPEMSKVLIDAGFKGNLTGELCRVFGITAAGAEGLSLKNVRRVHIMEPFWNHVRTDQVKGRAVRICSHIDLDYSEDPALNQRTVEVYNYCSVFDPQAIVKPDGSSGFPRIDQTILNGDGLKPAEAKEMGFTVPDGAVEYVITSDQHLYQLSERKKKVLQNIQDLMKTNAVDCKINVYENEEEGLGCITLPGTPQQYAFHPNLKKDIAETSTRMPDSSVGVDVAVAEAAPAPIVSKPVLKKTIQARQIVVDKIPYLAIPKIDRGQVLPLTYDLYSRGDLKRTKKIGISMADAQGNPTSDLQLYT